MKTEPAERPTFVPPHARWDEDDAAWRWVDSLGQSFRYAPAAIVLEWDADRGRFVYKEKLP